MREKKIKKIMKKAALHNLGCKVNAYETEAMQQMLEEAGYEIVPFEEAADVYIVNTCSVTNIADRKSRQMLRRARRRNPDAVIVAAGCYVQAAGQELQDSRDIQDMISEGMADIVLGNNKKKDLIQILAAYEEGPKGMIDFEDINDVKNGPKEYERLSITRTAGHTRAFMKVQDGCDQFCSYCIIPYTRGRVRSRPSEDILAEARILAAGGYKEIVLTGIHLSSYGIDTGDDLLHLAGRICQIPGIGRIRFGSLEPGIITEGFAAALAGMEKICPHFHLSLQSGCDTVLKRMGRKYDTAEYEERCQILRRHFPYPAITTDVIVGFPGETEEEFQATRHFLERIRFYEMHIFKYSKRKGTRAARMEGQVPEPVKAQRSAHLSELGERMSGEFRKGLCGQRRKVLLEEPFTWQGETYHIGYTQEYVRAAVKQGIGSPGQFVEGRIQGQLTQDIYLMVEF